ncbi:hypothetical protein [Streptomyces sp. NPDC050287]|uniref:hypothetical protein n=1 Tax=Streptomyces sp. NPDC050287 TaxID=3365608 RepID=UPI0037BC2255
MNLEVHPVLALSLGERIASGASSAISSLYCKRKLALLESSGVIGRHEGHFRRVPTRHVPTINRVQRDRSTFAPTIERALQQTQRTGRVDPYAYGVGGVDSVCS